MKAAMTAVKLATVRKISYPTGGMKSEASGSDRSIKNGSTSENDDESDVEIEKTISREIQTVTKFFGAKLSLL